MKGPEDDRLGYIVQDASKYKYFHFLSFNVQK